MRVLPTLFTASLLGVLAPVAAQAQTMPMTSPDHAHHAAADSPLLSFSITEEMRSAPDTASIGAGVTTTAPTAVQAMRDNAEAMTRMTAALRRAGIEGRNIQTSGISLSPQYDYTPQQQGEPPRLIGYQVTNQVRVATTDIARLGDLLDALVTGSRTLTPCSTRRAKPRCGGPGSAPIVMRAPQDIAPRGWFRSAKAAVSCRHRCR